MPCKYASAMLALSLLITMTGCAQTIESVDTTYNRSVDFAALKTYNWWVIRGLDETDKQDLALIRRLIDQDLQGKGLRIDEKQPDFLVVVLLRKSRQTEINEIKKSWSGWTWDPGRPVYWGGPVAWNYEEGTMVIDLVRPETNHMVWRGTVRTDLAKVNTPEARTHFFEQAVRRVMAAFPPQ